MIHFIEKRARPALFALAILLMLGHFAVYVHYAVGLMRFPFDYDQGEGFELVDTIMFSEGEWPYRDNETYPFYASNYPPLFHVLLVPFVWLFGEAYWYGRLAGFAATLITAGTLAWIVHRETGHRPIAALSGLAYLASNVIYHVGPLFRQHISMVMFETLAIALLAHVLQIEDQARRRRLLAVGLALLLAAGYTKQLALATCVAVFVFLFLRSPRRSLAWGVVFAAVAGVLFLGIDLATGGEWWKNTIAANVNSYIPSQFVGLFKQWLRLHAALIILAALLAAYELYFDRLSLYSVWWVFAVADTLLSGKWGAGDSYFATAIAATCLMAGIAAARSVQGGWHIPADHPYGRLLRRVQLPQAPLRAALGVVIPALYLVYGLSVVKLPTEGAVFEPLADALGLESSYGARYAFYDSAGWTAGYATIGHVPTQTDIDNGWHIVDVLRSDPRPAMSEEAGFSLRADRDVITNPTQLKNLYENDLFDPAALVEALRMHEFGFVVFRAQFYPPPVLDAVYEAYYPAESVPMNGFNYEIWRPGPAADARTALAVALAADAPAGDAVPLLDLPLDEAGVWLVHALTYHNWEPAEALDAAGACLVGTYQQASKTVTVRLCPVEDGTQFTLE